jgi:hypothetical protein
MCDSAWAVLVLVALLGTAGMACVDGGEARGRQPTRVTGDRQVKAMKIRITIEGTTVAATLDDNKTATDFASLLPLTLTLEDYAATEKISDLPRKLSTQDAPPGHQPSAGEIAYYAPWGNLALFHRDFSYSAGLVRLGSIETGVELLRRPGPLRVTIERTKE